MLLGLTTSAQAQSFLYQPFTGSRNITVNFSSDTEWVIDPWSGTGTPAPRPVAYGANLHERRRLIANPYVRTVALRLASFRTEAAPFGGLADSVTLRWTNTTTGMTTASGIFTSAIIRTLGATGTNNLMNPGPLGSERELHVNPVRGGLVEDESVLFAPPRTTDARPARKS